MITTTSTSSSVPTSSKSANPTKVPLRLPNELVAELCKSVKPNLGIWNIDGNNEDEKPRSSDVLLSSAKMFIFLEKQFRRRKDLETSARDKACIVCGQEAFGTFGTRICVGCKCFFVRHLRDPSFCSHPCTCDDSRKGPIGCKHCRLQKCMKVGMPVLCAKRRITAP